jgi:peptide/nickel transport system permease protein
MSDQRPVEAPPGTSVVTAPPLVSAPAAGSTAQLPSPIETTQRSGELWRRFFRRKMAVIGAVLVAAFVVFGLLGPVLTQDPAAQNFSATLEGPSAAHWLGTDSLGRDVLARAAHGALVSLQAGVGSTLLAMFIGVPVGLVAGFYRRWTDAVTMRGTEVLMSFPFVVLAVGLAATLGPSLRNVIIAMAVFQLPTAIRIARGEALMLRQLDFISGAVADGAKDSRILVRYLLPNAMSPLIVQATVTIPAAIIGEATLSFLGLGVQPPDSSWGIMLTNAQPYLSQAPYLALVPGFMIVAAALGFNLLGDGVRDVLDPRSVR